MRIVFDELAKRELEDGIEFYEIEVKGLGQKFQSVVSLRGAKRRSNLVVIRIFDGFEKGVNIL